jgi:hypothetical protein
LSELFQNPIAISQKIDTTNAQIYDRLLFWVSTDFQLKIVALNYKNFLYEIKKKLKIHTNKCKLFALINVTHFIYMYSGILIKASLKSFLSVPFVNEKEL